MQVNNVSGIYYTSKPYSQKKPKNHQVPIDKVDSVMFKCSSSPLQKKSRILMREAKYLASIRQLLGIPDECPLSPAQIRAALARVRNSLGLGSDADCLDVKLTLIEARAYLALAEEAPASKVCTSISEARQVLGLSEDVPTEEVLKAVVARKDALGLPNSATVEGIKDAMNGWTKILGNK
ncbi:MAG: hypothetical protein PHC64_06985 [Candidatus Gastranaerophilales bacterium]|nr:hypothetical protein [Candidatus Gastranaerophilales bacterium]